MLHSTHPESTPFPLLGLPSELIALIGCLCSHRLALPATALNRRLYGVFSEPGGIVERGMRRFQTVERLMYEESYFGNIEVLKRLLQLADNIGDREPGCPQDLLSLCLTVSCRHNHEPATLLFVCHGAHIDGASEGSLCAAVSGGHLDLARTLLDLGASLQRKVAVGGTRGGDDVLTRAVKSGNAEVVQLVLIHSRTHMQSMVDSALATAVRFRVVDIVAILLSHGADPNSNSGLPLCEAVTAADIPTLEFLLSHPDSPGSTATSTALVLASRLGLPDAISLLLDTGADVNYDAGAPLLKAVSRGVRVDVVKLLLESGADVDLVGLRKLVWMAGWYPTGEAVVQMLLEHVGIISDGGGWVRDGCIKLSRRSARSAVRDKEMTRGQVEQLVRQYEHFKTTLPEPDATPTRRNFRNPIYPPATAPGTAWTPWALEHGTGAKVALWWAWTHRRVLLPSTSLAVAP